MKKIYLITLIAALPFVAQGQSALDALRYSQNFYSGTARSAAMGNAVTALGGDFGSLSINPAGSAVYPYSEFIFTPSIHNAVSQSAYSGSTFDDNLGRMGISNIGYVGARKTSNYSGVVGFSFGIGYNGVNNYTHHSSLSGVTNESSWLAALAYNTGGYHAYDLDLNDRQDPFYTTSAPWRAILAWNTSLLDTIPGTRGREYIAATESFKGNEIGISGNLNQNYYRKSIGSSGEYVFNLGVNISHRLFLGVNLGVHSIYYETHEQFSESAVNKNEFYQSEFHNFTHTYYQKTDGTGVNFKFGAILVPVDNLRLGFSISTPTWMSLNEEWEETITANFTDGYHQTLKSPLGTYEYQVYTPFRWNLGAALTFGPYGAISVDYEKVAYNRINMSSTGTTNPFLDENTYIKREFADARNVRAGLELNLNSEFALRGGYAFYGNPEKNWGFDTHIASIGIGLNWGGAFFTDLTFMQQFAQKENFSLYDDITEGSQVIYPAPVGTQTSSNWKLLFSLGLRF